METDGIAVVRPGRRCLRLAQRQRRADALAVEVPDRLAALADDLVDLRVPERREQLAVERQAPVERRDDEIEVVESAARQAASLRPGRAEGGAGATGRSGGAALAGGVVESDEEAGDAERFPVAATA